MGKEWTTSKGVYVNHNPMWVKVVNKNGEISHVDWIDKYKKLRKSVNIEFPGL
jgi:soluble calcium-activated nucleotidase 1